MSATLSPLHVTAAPVMQEEFVDLVCADEELLRAAFDEIITAEWPEPPSTPPVKRHARPPSGGRARPRRWAADGVPRGRSHRPIRESIRRQRSPP